MDKLRRIIADEGLAKKADKIQSRGLRISLSHAESIISSITRDLQALGAVARKLENEALEYQGHEPDLLQMVEGDAKSLKGLVEELHDRSSAALKSAQALTS
jgi:hypothetical protein